MKKALSTINVSGRQKRGRDNSKLLLAITYLSENKVEFKDSFLSPLSLRLRSFIFISIMDIDAAVIS
jgi:hypothetical protein